MACVFYSLKAGKNRGSAMNKALHNGDAKARRQVDWRKKMSDNVAYGLLVYTGLQIFVTMHELQGASASILPVFVLVMLVAAIIPLFRQFERRWEHLGDEQAHDMAFRAAFRRDQVKVWLLAAVLPFVITGAFKLLSALF
ncbi:hypothetical protein Saro_0295 [Novosphingobium aromaticivorans DSM 12444]|uniref:Uncharacterized protein n=2 Tax=Novosphingobium aromaticivorans TaxID=48935 RepID=Q2GBN0_NOVAD|nr:hypothetical protein Saro_0295 [Novosphingobium aromaticivorans DSM 12444]